MIREPTPEAKRRDHVEPVLLAAIGGLVVALFHFFGNTSNIALEGRSLFIWIGRQLLARSGDFAHTWVIPLVSIYVVYHIRQALRDAPKRVSRLGLLAVTGALFLHALAMRVQQPRISMVALTGLLAAIPYALYGPQVARLVAFPCAYLLLGFTSYALVYFSFHLRLLSTILTAGLLNGIGIATVRSGTALFSTAGGGFQFDVADPCSGLRSLVVMAALAAPYAYFTLKSRGKQWLLFALSLPLAIFSNTLRVVSIALLAQGFGQEFAMRVYHDFSGYLTFGLSILLLTVAAVAVERAHFRRRKPS